MDLKEFVSQSLCDIVSGTKDAAENYPVFHFPLYPLSMAVSTWSRNMLVG
jgi:hypothetical protein